MHHGRRDDNVTGLHFLGLQMNGMGISGVQRSDWRFTKRNAFPEELNYSTVIIFRCYCAVHVL